MNPVHLSRTDLNLLVLFEVVLEERHVGRAARRMNLTPSAVSHGLGRLRRLLGDPLFLKTPKGVVPTARALELAAAVGDVLARARSLIASAEPFQPGSSTRRFTIGAPDGASAVLVPSLLERLRQSAPGIGIGLRQLLPMPGASADAAWGLAFAELETRALDVAIVPSDRVPPRFHKRLLYREDFVVALRAGHPHARRFTLDRYCAMQHLVVSQSGDPHGFVDDVLASHGRARRIAMTVPDFTFALMAVADSDLACVVPRRFAEVHAARLGVVSIESPVPLPRYRLHAVVPEQAMMDLGVAWLLDIIEASVPARAKAGGRAAASRR
ncbi:LysR family transcriptional regulator [Ramlibacter solisilvae]|uniref:LysR family transcriptional regulator n=1 Tax=Ramlibacter tataouinensis TaxID=94132 RepID=UPI000AD5EEDE|nr:LysR family transcriptional regulator [Ramlibacter tataouinensis]